MTTTSKRVKTNENLFRDFFAPGTIQVRAEPDENSENGTGEKQTQDNRQVELSLSSEEPYRRWFGTEYLSHEADAIDLTRLQDGGVVLFNHNRDAVLGKVLSVELDEGERKLRAVIEFDPDEEADKIYQKVKSGTLKGVSVGYTVEVWENVTEGAVSSNGRFAGPCEVATKWTPCEISIVSVPADPTVGVGRALDPNKMQTRGSGQMATTKANEPTQAKTVEPNTQTRAAEPMQTHNEPAQQRNAGVMAERQRVQEITRMCRQFGMNPDEYIEKGISVDNTRAAVLEQLAQQRGAQNVSVNVDEMDKFRAAATDGLAMRAGIAIAKPAPGAEEIRGKSMMRLAAECVEREKNESTRHMSDETLLREALTGTGAYPGILSNVANKSMAQAYQTAPTTYQFWAAAGSNADFKEATRYRLGEADELVKINEAGEFKAGTVAESAAKTSVATYGRTFSLTRQAIINDDLGALNQLPSIYGAAARRMINKMVYKVLKDNPTIEGAPLFDAKHNNLQKADLTVAGLGTVKAAMAKQQNIGGKEYLNIQPAFLIVPVELEVVAAQLINSVVDPSKNNAAYNPFANKLTVVSEPELLEATSYYLAAAPGYAPTIEVTSLNGNLTPTMESAVQFDTLGIKWRIYQDVGVNLLDYRGIQKSTAGK